MDSSAEVWKKKKRSEKVRTFFVGGGESVSIGKGGLRTSTGLTVKGWLLG